MFLPLGFRPFWDDIILVFSRLGQIQGDVDWSGCPESESNRLTFSAFSTVKVHRIRGEWFYPTEFHEKVAPLAALGQVHLMGQAHTISEGCLVEERSARSA